MSRPWRFRSPAARSAQANRRRADFSAPARPESCDRADRERPDRMARRARAQWPQIGGIAPPDLGYAGQAQRFDILALERPALGVAVHQQAETRASRQRFDAERARAGE